MTRKEARETEAMLSRLQSLGISRADAEALRRISMTLHRWSELECGVDGGGIDRDEETGKCWWYSSYSGKRTHIVPDREKGALERLAKIMARYPTLLHYVQGDPRGCALYILRPGDVPAPVYKNVDAYYTRGIAVHQ